MKAIKIFRHEQFGEIRICLADAKELFCLSDVCKALAIGNPSDVKRRLSGRGVDTIETPIKNQFGTVVAQKMIYIDEPNLYRCIFQSRKAEAEQFQDWVFEEVLPSIRRNGAYLTDDALARFAEDPDYGIKLLNTLKRERTERLALMKENVTLSLENERMKPMAG